MTKFANRYWGDKPLPTSKLEFFDAVTTPSPSGSGTVATIRMYGPIDSWGGFWGISTKDVGAVLDALPDTVTQIVLRINSPGGEVFEGLAILNMLRAHKATVTGVVDGLAASAASVIAAGCDDTVMSPGTQMMIHSPSVISWGNAVDLRKTAEILDSIEASLIEIYQEKAGLKDWAALLAEETWLTAEGAVELGLADRTAVIPDAGETETVGADPLVLEGDFEDSARATARGIQIPDRVAARSTMLPISAESGDPNRKDDLVAYEDLTAGLRERLGVTDAAATDEQLLAAVDEALAESAADVPAPVLATAPAGTVLVDAEAHADLVSAAAEGRAARAQQIADRREAIVDAAVKDGRIKASGRDKWLSMLAADEAVASAAIADLQANSVPVKEVGHQVELSAASSLAAQAGWAVPTTEEN